MKILFKKIIVFAVMMAAAGTILAREAADVQSASPAIPAADQNYQELLKKLSALEQEVKAMRQTQSFK